MAGLGFDFKYVRVTAVDASTGFALVRDRLGKEDRVNMRVVRVNLTPVEGESWIIDRMFGVWSFAAKVVADS